MKAERLWGKVAWGLKTESGESVWDELDLLRAVSSLPPQAELPLISLTYSSNQEQTHKLAEALMVAGHAVATHTAWGGQRMIPVSATATNWCLPLDIRKDRAMLAVFDSGETRDAVRNGSLLWQVDDMVDQPDRFAVTLRQDRGQFAGTITLRRLQRFAPQPGERCTWKFEPVEVTRLALWIANPGRQRLLLVSGGSPTGFAEHEAAAIFGRPEIHIQIDLGLGEGKDMMWSTDLTHEYVTINADYRT